MIPAAVLPAMAIAPKELMDDWINTLEIEKIAPCNPAGSPIWIIRIIFSL